MQKRSFNNAVLVFSVVFGPSVIACSARSSAKLDESGSESSADVDADSSEGSDLDLPNGEVGCQSPAPIIRDGLDTGLVQCDDGAVNRTSEASCSNPVDSLPLCDGSEMTSSCSQDSDCLDPDRSSCKRTQSEDGKICSCVYNFCVVDSDCPDSLACVCSTGEEYSPNSNKCMNKGCRIGSDCTSGECGVAYGSVSCPFASVLACRTSGDECRTDDDCDAGLYCRPSNMPTEDAPWKCMSLQDFC